MRYYYGESWNNGICDDWGPGRTWKEARPDVDFLYPDKVDMMEEYIGKEFTTGATMMPGSEYFTNFGITRKTAHIWGLSPEGVYDVTLKVSGDQSEPDRKAQEYWGWFDYGERRFTLIYPNYLLLNICFPYGIRSFEQAGAGKSYRLEVTGFKKQ